MEARVIVVNASPSFHGLTYHRRIGLGAEALPLVLLLEEIHAKLEQQDPEKWAVIDAETDARTSRERSRHIIRHDVAFAATRRSLRPGVDEISIPPPAPKTRKTKTRKDTR